MIDESGTYIVAGHNVKRVGYGAMRPIGAGVIGPPHDHDAALPMLRADRPISLRARRYDITIRLASLLTLGDVRSFLRDAAWTIPSNVSARMRAAIDRSASAPSVSAVARMSVA